MIQLRDYQSDAVHAVYEWMRYNAGNPVCVAPTGSGKAVLIAKICADAHAAGRRVIVLAHVKELLEQEADKLRRFSGNIDFGVYSAGLNSRDIGNRILVAGIQSVYKRAEELGGFNLVIVDEAHRVSTRAEGMYRSFLQDLQAINPDTRLVGFTATPWRTGEGRIYGDGKLFDDIAYEIDIESLVEQGFLSPLVTKSGVADSLIDYDQAHIERGDFVTSEIEELALNFPRLYSSCRDFVKKTEERRSAVVFCISVHHAEKVLDIMQNLLGQKCALLTGKTPAIERERLLTEFKSGNLKYLLNVNVLTTGFDAPGIDSVILLRPTASPVLYVQMVGRGFRIAPGKKNCLVLDYGGNVMRHGPVTNVNVKDGTPERTGERKASGKPGMKTCPNCDSIIERYWLKCPDCDYEFPVHETESAEADVMGGKPVTEEHEVREVQYRVWQKRDDPEAPRTMRVDYRIGYGEYVAEWVCPEHTGYAFQKFCEWWEQRCEIEPPETAEECVEYAKAGLLAEPKFVTTVQKPGEKYRKIQSVKLGEIPEAAELPVHSETAEYSEFSQLGDLDF